MPKRLSIFAVGHPLSFSWLAHRFLVNGFTVRDVRYCLWHSPRRKMALRYVAGGQA